MEQSAYAIKCKTAFQESGPLVAT